MADLLFDSIIELNQSLNFSRESPTQWTPDRHKDSAKIFVEEMNVRDSFLKKSTRKIINTFLTDFKLPAVGEMFRIRTQQQINLISIVLKIVKVHKEIDELTIATYTLNKESFGIILDLIRAGRIHKLTLFLSSSYGFRDSTYYDELKTQILLLHHEFDVHLVFAWLHLKISLFRCGVNFYLHEGSMNYSTNNMCEQLLIENCQESYDYDFKFLHQTLLNKKNKALEIVC